MIAKKTNDNPASEAKLLVMPATHDEQQGDFKQLPEVSETSPSPSAAKEQEEISQLIEEAKDWRLRGHHYRVALGRVLIRLRALLAKPGYGSFMRTVREEIGIPYTTANDYMQEAAKVDGQFDLISQPVNEEVVPYEPNDGEPDAVEVAINMSKEIETAALQRAQSATILRDFNWKFRLVTREVAEQLKAARSKLGQEYSAQLLIVAGQLSSEELDRIFLEFNLITAKEANNEELAA